MEHQRTTFSNTAKEARKQIGFYTFSGARYRKMLGSDIFLRRYHEMVREDNMEQVFNELSGATNARDYFEIYVRHFERLFTHYKRPFYRKWKFRRYCLRRRAEDALANELLEVAPVGSYDAPPVGEKKRNQQARRGRKKRKKRNQMQRREDHAVHEPLPQPLPPVVFFGDGSRAHVKKHPPTPVQQIINKLSRRSLVVMFPEFRTSARCNVHPDTPLEYTNVEVQRCNHRYLFYVL